MALLNTQTISLVGSLALATAIDAHAQAQPRRDSAAVNPPAPASALAARPARQSWTSDRRSFGVGDLIVITLDEFTLASARSNSSASSRRRRDADFGLQTPGAAVPMGASFDSRNDAESQQRGDNSRQLRLQGELVARVMTIDPVSGVLTIKGSKDIGVDKDRQSITFTGAVRPQDLGGRNTIESSRVADAKLDIVNKGSLGKPKGGMVGRILGALWP
jgi:flagellar L-ring protein FlgH